MVFPEPINSVLVIKPRKATNSPQTYHKYDLLFLLLQTAFPMNDDDKNTAGNTSA